MPLRCTLPVLERNRHVSHSTLKGEVTLEIGHETSSSVGCVGVGQQAEDIRFRTLRRFARHQDLQCAVVSQVSISSRPDIREAPKATHMGNLVATDLEIVAFSPSPLAPVIGSNILKM
jgi:hypothetical protein